MYHEPMTSLLAAALFSMVSMPICADKTVTLASDEDVWVYPHSNDPGNDPFMRIWGVGGVSVAPSPGDVENFSYGYLKFNLKDVPTDKKLVSAHLILIPAGKPTISAESKEWPLEARGLGGKFEEKTWTHTMASDISPKKDALYGSGVITAKGEEFEIKIDLLGEKSSFAKDFKATTDAFFFGLTSKYDVADLGMKGIYKVYTRDNKDKNVHPRLELKFATE
jgi:hypothetical protein